MKTMRFLLPTVLVILYLLNLHAEDFHYVQGVEYQSKDGMQENLARLCEPVTMTATGINYFLRSIYNEPLYAQELLPHNLSHLFQFLAHGKKTKQPRVYIQSVMRLFGNKVKACAYIDARAFDELLEQLPDVLNTHFTITRLHDYDQLRTRLNDILYANFLEKFTHFKQDPHMFLGNLSQAILDEIGIEPTEMNVVSTEELRKTVLIFLEVVLGKLIWNVHDKEATWTLVKSISQHLTTLLDHTIITDPDDLNDLFITLTERYCYFLDVAATDLPIELYTKLKEDIAATSLPLLEFEEQDEHIERKAQRLLRAITHAEARCRAYHHGAITQ